MIACGWCGGQEAMVVVAVTGGLAFVVNGAGWLWLQVCKRIRLTRKDSDPIFEKGEQQ